MKEGDKMNIQINCTQEGVKNYPLHRHDRYEAMLYLQGTGFLHTPLGDHPFSPGSILLVPPGVEHGSRSENGFKNISICGDFDDLFHIEEVVALSDNREREATALVTMIYNNRFLKNDYLSKLCAAYTSFILQNIGVEKPIDRAVYKMVSEIDRRFCDSNISLQQLLQNSGYAPDYMREQFKRIMGKTPIAFLTHLRIERAVYLIDVYAKTLSLQQIAEMCGYLDYVYFYKRFRSVKGVSPQQYKTMVLQKD